MATQKPALKVIGPETSDDLQNVIDTNDAPKAEEIAEITTITMDAIRKLKEEVEASTPERAAA